MLLREKTGAVGEVAAAFGLSCRECLDVRSIYRITDVHGRVYALKPYRLGISSLQLAALMHQKAEVYARGLLPALRPTVSGEAYQWFKGTRYLCFEWVEGTWLDYLQRSHRRRALRTVLQWREAARGVLVPKALRYWRRRQTAWVQRLIEMERCKRQAETADSAFSRLYLQKWDYYHRQAVQGLRTLMRGHYQQLAKLAEAEGRVCHGDWAHHNLILSPGGKVTLLDLEYLRGDLPVQDLADLLRQFLSLDGNNLEFIPIYFKWAKELGALLPEEAETLAVILSFPEDYWMIGRQYFIERLSYSENYWLQRYSRKVPAPGLRDRWLAEIFRAAHGKG